MSSSLKRVDPGSVATYGPAANTHAGNVFSVLQGLLNDVVGVQYFGPNAFKFKTDAGKQADTFADAFMKDFINFAQSVASQTSNLAGSLGGGKINITVDVSKLNPPTPEVVDYVEVETTALTELIETVDRRFQSVKDELDSHVKTVKGLDWIGNTQQNTMEFVTTWTSKARTTADDARTALVDFIKAQIEQVDAADASVIA